jgi:hypothetical protein
MISRRVDRLRERDHTACQSQQPSTRLYGQPPPEEGDSKTAAQRSKGRRGEISYRRAGIPGRQRTPKSRQ